jgi:large subunit ribosomal protein L32
MGVPKKRTSAQKRDQRRANWKITAPNVMSCTNCGEAILSHRVCAKCGFYDGKQVIAVKQA